MAIGGGDGQGVAGAVDHDKSMRAKRTRTRGHHYTRASTHTHRDTHSYHGMPKRDAIYCHNLT